MRAGAIDEFFMDYIGGIMEYSELYRDMIPAGIDCGISADIRVMDLLFLDPDKETELTLASRIVRTAPLVYKATLFDRGSFRAGVLDPGGGIDPARARAVEGKDTARRLYPAGDGRSAAYDMRHAMHEHFSGSLQPRFSGLRAPGRRGGG
jgi:hypothetical protein